MHVLRTQCLKNRMKVVNAKGFTLVEIMIVFVTIGMLAVMMLHFFVRPTDQTRMEEIKVDFRNLTSALAVYQTHMKDWPTTEQGLKALYQRPEDLSDHIIWQGPYLQGNDVPKDPWGNDYLYRSPGEHKKSYDLYSLGADGQAGGQGMDAEIGNWNLDY